MKKLRLLAKRSKFLKTFQEPVDDPVDNAVKRIILNIAGDNSTDPSTLRESLKLKDNLHYGDDEYRLLQIRLNDYARSKNKDASVSTDEASGCDSVGDCIALVERKIS